MVCLAWATIWVKLRSEICRIARKFGGVCQFGSFRRNRQSKIRLNLYRVHVCMAILFQTTKFKSANTQFGGKPPNLMTANISGYTVVAINSVMTTSK